MNATFLELIEMDASRLAQMRIVERVVRPLKASKTRKRKIREEMLAHLSAIYAQELEKRREPQAALTAAAKRFGIPMELTAELQTTVPTIERYEYFLERTFGWRPPESTTRYMVRVSLQTAAALSVFLLAVFLLLWGFDVSRGVRQYGIRPFVAITIVMPLLMGAAGILHFKIRDSMFGVFGSRKSKLLTFVWAALLAVVITMSWLAFLAMAYADLSAATSVFYRCLIAGIAIAVGLLVFARISGPDEIRDTHWALLDLG